MHLLPKCSLLYNRGTMIDDLLSRYAVISDQVSKEDIHLILSELSQTLQRNVPGAIVELGCYIGTTSLFIRRLLDQTGTSASREFHAYDSFAGLPPKHYLDKSAMGEGFKEGELAVSKSQFIREFQRAGLRPPITHKAWFEHLTPADLPDPIAFAFLDGDFYQSILASLRLVWPKMSPGGVVLIDDYGHGALPGVKRAVQDFFLNRQTPQIQIMHDIAIIHD